MVMKRRIVMALALAGLIGAAVVNRIKPEHMADKAMSTETTDLLTTMSGMPANIEVIELEVTPAATLDKVPEGAPEACARPEILTVKEYLKKDASEIQSDDDLLLEEGKKIEHTEMPSSLSIDEKVPAMEPVKTMPDVTQSVEATPLPPMQAAPAVQDLKQDAVGRFGGGKFK